MSKPPKPRPQHPHRRREPSNGNLRRRGLIAVGVLLATAVVALAALILRGGGEEPVATADAPSACPTRQFPEQEAIHVETLPAGFEYNSNPPTSGAHHPVPAVWGSYTEPVPSLNLVHNLEHGGVVVQYGSAITADVRARIEDWYRADPNGIVVAPLASLNEDVVATAWTWRATCTGFDEEALTDFRDEHRARGPERFPLESLAPGT